MRSIIRINDWPIFYKLLAALLVLGIIALVPVSLINQQQARQGLLQEAQRNLSNTARNTSNILNDYLLARQRDIDQIAFNEAVAGFMKTANTDRASLGPNNRDQRDTLNLLATNANQLGRNSYVFIASPNGQVELTSERDGVVKQDEPVNVTDQFYFQDIIVNKKFIVVSDLIINRYNEATADVIQAFIYFAAPIRDTTGQTLGIAVMRVDAETIWNIVNNDKESAGAGSFSMLVDSAGIRIADSRIADSPASRARYLFSPMYQLPATGPGSRAELLATGRFTKDFDLTAKQDAIPGIFERAVSPTVDPNNRFFELNLGNEGYEAAFARVTTKPWTYYVVVPDATYAKAANNITTTGFIIGGIAFVLLLLAAFLMANALTSPVRRIRGVLARIGMGDFEARVPVTSQDEMGKLGETLNAMFDNTLTLIQTREEKEELQDQVMRLLEEISTVAEGDLTVQAEVTADITGAIADSFNLMIEELRKVITNIQRATGQTTSNLELMIQNSQRMDIATDRQANRIMAVTGSVGEMNSSIQRVSASANDAARVAQEARSNARSGGEAVAKTIGSMNRIRGNVQETAKKIKRLGESSQQIGEIVKLIDGIADQTNMLALNAAIQAATAGEQGKGFSMVTEEVRRLAQRSANAAREIASLVKSIQDDTNAAVVAMEESTSEVVEGSKVADNAGQALNSIEQVVSRLADLILNISQVSVQQASTSGSIAQSMTEISSLTQEATALRRQSSEVVEMVARTAEDLRNSVSAFKVTTDKDNTSPDMAQFAPPVYPFSPPETSYPVSNGNTHQVTEDGREVNSLLTEDSEFFDSIFGEVATATPGAPKPGEKDNPQALG